MIICYTVPENWHVTNVIYSFCFGPSFAFFPLTAQKHKNETKKRKRKKEIHGDVIILHICNKNYDQRMYCS